MEYNFVDDGTKEEEGRKKWSTSIAFQGSELSEERTKERSERAAGEGNRDGGGGDGDEMCKTPSSSMIGD